MIISDNYAPEADVILYHGRASNLFDQIPDGVAALVVTSPPLHESRLLRDIDTYVGEQSSAIYESARILKIGGSMCWQVGNLVQGGETIPLDVVLHDRFVTFRMTLRKRIIWANAYGRGGYETIMWYSKGGVIYYTDAEPPDVWDVSHIKEDKVDHPCPFPVNLIEQLILMLTNKGDLVVDPYIGVGSTAIAAHRTGRKVAGADIAKRYLDIAAARLSVEETLG